MKDVLSLSHLLDVQVTNQRPSHAKYLRRNDHELGTTWLWNTIDLRCDDHDEVRLTASQVDLWVQAFGESDWEGEHSGKVGIGDSRREMSFKAPHCWDS